MTVANLQKYFNRHPFSYIPNFLFLMILRLCYCLFICVLSIRLCYCLSVCVIVCPSVLLSVRLCYCMSVCVIVCPSVLLSIRLCNCLSVCVVVHPNVCQPVRRTPIVILSHFCLSVSQCPCLVSVIV